MPATTSLNEFAGDFLAENWVYIVILIVLGLAGLWAKLVGGRQKKEAAQQIAETTNKAFHSGFRWQAIELSSIKHLDLKHYQEVTEELAASGFQPVGDVELLHVTEATPKLRTGMRVFGVQHGTIMAATFQVKVRGLMGLLAKLFNARRDIRVVEFQTALSDGRWIVTNNSGDANAMSDHAMIQYHKLDPEVGATQLLARHIEFVKAQLAPGGATPVVANTLDGIMALEAQQHQLQSSHREAVGPVTEDELEKLAPEISAKDRQEVAQEAGRLSF